MKKTLTALTAAGTMALATVATPTAADARWGWWGPALGAFAAGAIIGGALARPYSGVLLFPLRLLSRVQL